MYVCIEAHKYSINAGSIEMWWSHFCWVRNIYSI